MMLVRDRGGDRAMSWDEFWAIFERATFRQQLQAEWAAGFVGPVAGRVADGCLKPRMLGWTTKFVGPVAGRTADGCWNFAHGTQTISQHFPG